MGHISMVHMGDYCVTVLFEETLMGLGGCSYLSYGQGAPFTLPLLQQDVTAIYSS